MISTLRITQAACDRCGHSVSYSEKMRVAMAILRALGWSIDSKGMARCPGCRKKK